MKKEIQFILYSTPQENVKIEAVVKDDTLWLTQKAMSQLFGVQVPAISKHLKNIFNEGELDENVVVSILETTTQHGAIEGKTQTQGTQFYNLDAIISVGYRVNSAKATHFRIWATKVLKEYMLKGFVLDDERLKQGETLFGKDYFRELLERVRSIRASERRIWQQITDIFAECSIDYDRNSPTTREFYAMVQNKFHYAITGQTAAEIIYNKADRKKENMGLTTWKNSPDGRILKSDVTIAKNYLPEKDIKRLERAVTGYFDYIEDLIERENTFSMEEFSASIKEFLAFRKYDILSDKGKITKAKADQKAETEYAEFNKTQKIISDFDKEIKRLKEQNNENTMNLQDLQRHIEQAIKGQNSRPITEFEGYSPSEMLKILYFTFAIDNPLQLQKLSDTDYKKIPILNQIKYLINLIDKNGEIKLTNKGFLPTKIVSDLYSQGFLKDELIESGISKLYKETDSMTINLTRILIELAGLAKKRNGQLSLTKLSVRFLEIMRNYCDRYF